MSSNSTEPTAPCNEFDRDIYLAVAGVAAISGFISLLASIFIISIIILFKKYQFFSQRLILYLAIASVAKSISTMVQRINYTGQTSTAFKAFCVFSGFFSQLTGWMILNSVVCITLSLLITTFFNKQQEKLEPYFIFFTFVFPFTINWIPFIKQAYGDSGVWCWIRIIKDPDHDCDRFIFGEVLQLVLWYIPLYTIMFLLIILYIIVLIKVFLVRQKWTGRFDPNAEENRKKLRQRILQLLFYPLIFFLLNIPLFANRIQAAVAPNKPILVLWFLAAAAFPLEGGVTAIAFSLDPSTRRRLTLTNIRAALGECGRRKRVVSEYPMENKMEAEVSLEKNLLKHDMLNSSTGSG